MVFTARDSHTLVAEVTIREEVIRRLGGLHNPPVSLINTVDNKNPSLRFEFIRKNILGKDVRAADPATRTACTKCKPHMGQGIGCEYSKVCDCLEYAAVNENAKMTPEEADRWQEIKANGGGDTSGLPKRFPYYSSEARRGCLVPQYLASRFPIYECNENCPCGPMCKTRVVQHGRKVRLEIFKTRNRGWGLRTKEALQEGQFIDTYRGEIITDAEATRREEESSSKDVRDSFLYSLDKFAEPLDIPIEDIYVIDGEFKGGPTRFINHSCQPNCRQYAVSYNKHDPRVYEIAFFAVRPIAPNEELTFDYLDKDEPDDNSATVTDPNERNEGGAKPTQCLCGAPKCRKWLWI
ncbi:SET domain-containing protein [Saccharata proteae CBS 121410]|uniref:SET domain-containing protein n=1 Tax=Saccharata proteae CBS 121410 TaxID=1314787 RepID=A0A9P4HR80_9PEZI|nr:SET domain-containing protein [Saccharata proteae CBS 121410]